MGGIPGGKSRHLAPAGCKSHTILIMLNSPFDSLPARSRAYAAGHVLFSRGEPAEAMHRVVEGLVELVRHGAEGGALVLHPGR